MSLGPDQHEPPANGNDTDPRAIVHAHWPSVYRLVYRLTGNAHDAEELTQEAFLRALQKLDQYTPGTNLRGWLLRIATNVFLDSRRRVRPRSADAAQLEAVAEDRTSAEIERMELAGQLQAALLGISETQRTVFLLRSTEDMSFKEISELIGTSEATARWHMLQARQELLKRLEGKL